MYIPYGEFIQYDSTADCRQAMPTSFLLGWDADECNSPIVITTHANKTHYLMMGKSIIH